MILLNTLSATSLGLPGPGNPSAPAAASGALPGGSLAIGKYRLTPLVRLTDLGRQEALGAKESDHVLVFRPLRIVQDEDARSRHRGHGGPQTVLPNLAVD